MPWPSTVTAGQQALASQFNSVVAALSSWGGNVSAAGNGMTDLSSVGMRSANASWQEFQIVASAGGSQSADALLLQWNGRSTAGGSDSWSTFASVAVASGALTIASNVGIGAAPRQALSVGGYLDLFCTNSTTVGSVAAVRADNLGNLVLSGSGSGALYLAWDRGTGGVNFGNGAAGAVAKVSPAGIFSCSGLSIPKFNAQPVFQTAGPISNASGSFTAHGGSVVFFLFASGFTSTVGVTGVNFNIDGTPQVSLKLYMNETSSHKALNSQIFASTVAAGSHNASFTAYNSYFQSDNNDFFQVYVIELPF